MKKIALITGVTRAMGLGFETARQLKELQFVVIITGRELAKVVPLAKQLGVLAEPLDITNDQSVEALAKKMDNDFGKMDVLINNAAGFFDQGGNALQTDLEYAKEAFETNVLGAWRMIKMFFPLLEKSQSPRIVNVSSGAASFADTVYGLGYHQSKVPVYGVTKLALNGLTVKLATQLSNSPIKINAVDPGFIASHPGTEQWGARPVADGAKGVVWAATLPDDGPSGGFFRDGETLGW